MPRPLDTARPGLIRLGIDLINDSYRLSRGGRLRADLGGVYFIVLVIVMLAYAYAVTGIGLLVLVVAIQP